MLYAHYDKNTKQGQLLQEHLQHVGQRMLSRVNSLNFPDISETYLKDLLRGEGVYHDIAKAMYSFQRYLQSGHGGMEKKHALLSAAVWSASDIPKDSVFKYLSVLAVARHHGDLEQEIRTKGQLFSQLSEQYVDYQKQIKAEHVVEIPGVPDEIMPDVFLKRFKQFVEHYYFMNMTDEEMSEQKGIEKFFVLQYLFSKLIWADKTDSADMEESPHISCTLKGIENYIRRKNKLYASVNEKRETIRQCVLRRIDELSDDEFMRRRIYLITAPTGTGKTLTSICAAVRIAERMETIYTDKAYIITAMPFVNILEQTFSDYTEIFGQDHVLAQYGAADLQICNHDEKNEDNALQKNMLILSAWEKPVVVTTFVQFFECIIGAKNNRLIKLNKLAGSVVILDEIQAMPIEYYALLGAVIYHLSQFYGTRFILMTATQPKIIDFANRILTVDKMKAYELLPNYETYYHDLRRTRIVPVFDQVQNNEQLVDFIEKTKPCHASALVVVNTIAQSMEVYRLLKDRQQDVLYLSTNLTPNDRKKIILVSQRFLKRKYPFILVSTQTIEAGVDLDFDIGYRDFAPLESIIQVAGRINRSGEKGEHSPLYIFDTGSSQYVYGTYFRQETRTILAAFDEIGEERYLQLIQDYYGILAKNLPCSRDIYDAMKLLDYKKLAAFHIIPEQQTIKTVLILRNQRVAGLAASYSNVLRGYARDFNTKIRLKQLLNELSRYTVEVWENKLSKNMPCRFSDVYGVDLDWYVVQHEEIDNYYDRTGFISEGMQALEY